MKKFVSILLVILSITSAITFSGCNSSDNFEDGVYICKTPYIKIIRSSDSIPVSIGEIEIDREVYRAQVQTDFAGCMDFIEYQEEDVNSTDGVYYEDNETYAQFTYKFDSKNKQIILTDTETGNVYHLNKLERLDDISDDVTVYTDNTMTPYEITEEQAVELVSLSYMPASLDELQGYLYDVTKLFSVNEVRIFDTEQEGAFYYSTFRYNESTIALIYDSDYWICGWIYYNEPVSLADLNEAKTLADVQKIDSTLTDNTQGFNDHCATTLVERRMYSLSETGMDFTAATTHFTEDGLYVIQYSQPLYEGNPEESKILSIERIDDEVYNTVYGLLNNKAVG